VFQLLFERSADAIWLLDPQTIEFVDCNDAAVRLMRARDKGQLLGAKPSDLSPPRQPDGQDSATKAAALTALTEQQGTQRFEWTARRFDGTDVPLEVMATPIVALGRRLNVIISRDITDRKRAEQGILELNQALERRISERTAELTAREALQRATYEISEAVHTTEDLSSLYRQIHRIISGLMPAKNFYIALLDRETEQISFAYHVDERTPWPPPMTMKTGLTSLVLRSGRPLLVGRELQGGKEGVGKEIRFRDAEGASYIACGVPAAVWLGVPLLRQGLPIGVLAVQDYEHEQAYGEGEKQILTFVAGQIALAIERKRVEQALKESEGKFRALFEASSQGVILHDEEKMLEVNPACLRILGFQKPEDMIGKHPADTSAPIQPNGESADVLARKHIQECIERGSARFDWVARNCSGREVPIEIVLTRTQLGGRQLIQAVFNDISERKRSEAELLKTLAREKELGQLKSNFVSMVSHEFRTPLGIIQSSAEILRDYFSQLDQGERAEQLGSIVKNTTRMADMMEEILVLSRLDAGKLEFKPEPVELGCFCQRMVEEVLSATDRRCPIELRLEDVSAPAQADERLMEHIFDNLLCNAVKYSEAGELVRFTVAREGAQVRCEIRDDGIGIPEADQPSLFHSFQRGGNVGDRPGTGLGLVLVKRCLDLHGGTVHVQSRLGQGTTVTVRLPVFSNGL
jgi:PAS domain S-box-containing protein